MSQLVHQGSFSVTMAFVTPLIGAPYKLHGRDPKLGWDCWGCCRYVRQGRWNRESPSWADAYDAALASSVEAVERLIQERLGTWVECDLVEGAALLFKVFGRKAHVGTYLGKGLFIHALQGCETAVEHLDNGRWKGRLVSAYECR